MEPAEYFLPSAKAENQRKVAATDEGFEFVFYLRTLIPCGAENEQVNDACWLAGGMLLSVGSSW